MSEIFPEDGEQAKPNVQNIVGLDLASRLPPGLIPASAVLIVHCLSADEDGGDVLWWSGTASLPSWEILGMCDFVQHSVRADWDAYTTGNGDEGEEE